MDCCNSIQRSPTFKLSPLSVKPQGGASASLSSPSFSFSPRKFTPKSQNLRKLFSAPESGRCIYSRRRCQPLVVAVANTESRGCKSNGVGTPHEPSSPEGRFLSGILQNQRHLFNFVMSEQLDELASDREGAAACKEQNSGSMESLLHRRIAAMKEHERQIAVEDVMYMSIVHKFSEAEVPMVPKLSECISNNTLEIWPSKCRELTSIHSLEVQEMIKEHLSTILRMRGKSNGTDAVTSTKIDRLHLGRIYATSIMYGYFLKSACFRRQLDSSLARDLQPTGGGTYLSAAESHPFEFKSLATLGQSNGTLATSICEESHEYGTKHEKLSSYVMGFDSESLQRCAKLKSKEAVNLIEKHTWALFCDAKNGELDSGNEIVITFSSLERLVLEAVTFGSFLWDVERSVDSIYSLEEN